MGGHVISVYASPVDEIEELLGSRDVALVAAAAATRAGRRLDDDGLRALHMLVEGTFPDGPQPPDHTVGWWMDSAFEALCEHVAFTLVRGVEAYGHQQQSPELHRLMWEVAGDDTGSAVWPAIVEQINGVISDGDFLTWHTPAAVAAFRTTFRALADADGYPGLLSVDEADTLAEYLDRADEAGTGTFVFTRQ